MGNTITPLQLPSDDTVLLREAPVSLTKECSLGKGRFLKTFKVIHDEGMAVCKVFIKPGPGISLEKPKNRLQEIRDTISRFMKNPNACSYSVLSETEKAGFAIRQFFQNNLRDRLGTRPFLTPLEKVWITFQLLKAVEKCHFAGIHHGDLKTENVMVTSWNWIFITDFAPYKPTFLPDNNPADFSYFFDTGSLRSCYLAPERFLPASKLGKSNASTSSAQGNDDAAQSTPTPVATDDSTLEASMDIFALGCVIAELWLEGKSLFELSELLSYRNVADPNRYDPSHKIRKIDNEQVQRLVSHMVQLNPQDRFSAGQYLKQWTSSNLFPGYFHQLHLYMANLLDLEPDDRVKIIAQDFDELLARFKASPDSAAAASMIPAIRSSIASSAEMVKRVAEPIHLTHSDEIHADKLAMNVTIPPSPLSTPTRAKSIAPFSSYDPISIAQVAESATQTELLVKSLEQLEPSGQQIGPNSSIQKQQVEAEQAEIDRTLETLKQEDDAILSRDYSQQTPSELKISFNKHKQFSKVAKETDDKTGLMTAYENLSSISRSLADYHKARKYNQKLLTLAQEMNHIGFLQRAHLLSGLTEQESGDMKTALVAFEKSLSYAQTLDDRPAQAQVAALLGPICLQMNLFDKAKDFQELYSQLRQEVGSLRPGSSAVRASRPVPFRSSGVVSERIDDASVVPAPGFSIILSLLCSLLRNLKEQQTRLLALDSLLKIAPHVDDNIRLQRIVPYIVSLFDADVRNARSASLVTAQAIKTLTGILELISSFPPSDSHIFPEYLLPALSFVMEEGTDELVVQALAECLPKLAKFAMRFLQTSIAFRQNSKAQQPPLEQSVLSVAPFAAASTASSSPPKSYSSSISPVVASSQPGAPGQLSGSRTDSGSSTEGTGPQRPQPQLAMQINGSIVATPVNQSSTQSEHTSYKQEVEEIRNAFKDVVILMLRDDAPVSVKKAILSNISELCSFFGKEQTNDVLLPLFFSCLNSKDWELKGIVFENIAGVRDAGADNLSSWVLSCILPQIYDESEMVVAGALNSLAFLCDLGIFEKFRMLEMIEKTAPLLLHPNLWIRNASVRMTHCVAQKLVPADIICFLRPRVQRFLVRNIVDFSPESLLQSLVTPLPRRSFDKALGGMFDSGMMTIEQDMVIIDPNEGKVGIETGTPMPGTRDLEFELALCDLDLPEEDTKKLIDMKDYIRVSSSKKRARATPTPLPALPDEYKQISEKITVHEIPITAAASASIMGRDALEQNEEWQDFFGRQSAQAPRGSVSAGSTSQDSPQGTPTRPSRKSDAYSFSSLRAKPSTPNLLSPPGSIDRSSFDSLPSVSSSRASFAASQSSSRQSLSPVAPPTVISSMPLAATSPLHALPANLVLPNIPKPPPELGSLSGARIYSGQSLARWRPSGVLVAHLQEHGGPVNEIQVSRDNLFFASASDDGTVKIWDCQRLEKNVTNRSRLTYSSQSGKISSICICENSHSVAAASTNGSIHVFRIERAKRDKASVYDYTALTTVQNLDKTDGAVVKVDHFDALSSSQSLIVYATDVGRIHAWDLRARKEAWVLENKAELGLITSFYTSPSHYWMSVGTNRGYISFWDIRFSIPFREWRLPDQSMVHSMSSLVPVSGEATAASVLVAAGPGDLAEWNLESSKCTRLLRVLTEKTAKLPELTTSPLSSTARTDWGLSDLEHPSRISTCIRTLSAFSLAAGSGTATSIPVNPAGVTSPMAPRATHDGTTFLFTAGTDKKIRYWDLLNPKNSYVVCGLEKLEPKPTYHSYTANEGTVDVIDELAGLTQEPITGYDDTGLREPNLDPPPSAHRDTILDLKVLESPSRLLVSASRDGVIKVWK